MKTRAFEPARIPLSLALAAVSAAASAPARADDSVVDWNTLTTELLTLVPSALNETRIYSVQHASIHDALNTIDPRYQRYSDCQGLGGPAQASVPAAVAEASRRTLSALWLENVWANPPLAGTDVQAEVQATIEEHYHAAMASIEDGDAKMVGMMIGSACADANLALRADDGIAAAGPPFSPLPTYEPGNEPGDYQFTPPFDQPPFGPLAVAPGWGDITPFGITMPRHHVQGPLKLSVLPYAEDFNYVKAIGSVDSAVRTPEQTEIADFWYENSPPGWNRIANTVVADRSVDAWDAARVFTLINFAMADGYIAGFKGKYDFAFWRPITAIRAAGADGNEHTDPDPTWEAYCVIPPVPDHPSTHTVLGAAAAEVLIRNFGDRTPFSTTSPSLPGVTRDFDSFSQAAMENGRSRVYCGIHFVEAVTAGYGLGRSIGREISGMLNRLPGH